MSAKQTFGDFMKIEMRDPNLKYPIAIRDEKITIILDWLLEFRFSSVQILAMRLGQSVTNSNRFFNLMLKNNLILSFKNVHTSNIRCYMLKSAGVDFLKSRGRDTTHSMTRVKWLGDYSKILHDLSVQNSILNRLEKFESLTWDKNIEKDLFVERPDALMVLKEHGAMIALEYERSRKDTKRIYYTFMNHIKAIQDKKVKAFFYDFQSEADMHFYRELFQKKEWPVIERDKKTGKARYLNKKIDTEPFSDLKGSFVFNYSPFG